jgi:hypothetical protein
VLDAGHGLGDDRGASTSVASADLGAGFMWSQLGPTAAATRAAVLSATGSHALWKTPPAMRQPTPV